MIVLVTGPPGAGKTWYAVRKIAEALDAGKPVVTNVDLADDWPERVAMANPVRWPMPWRRRRLADEYRRRVLFTHDLAELQRVRFRGAGEGRAVAVIDEAHRQLDARGWNEPGRKELVDWFTLHRKVGLDVYLISQDADNVDARVRRLFEYHVQLRNLKRIKVLGLSIVPCNFFLALWRWHGDRSNLIVKRELYRLSRLARAYDTTGMSGAIAIPPDAIWLPRVELAEVAGDEDLDARAA